MSVNGFFKAALCTLGATFLQAVPSPVKSVPHPHHRKASKVITVTKKDHDSTVRLQNGGMLAVRLEWSPGTGNSWTVASSDGDYLQVQGEPKSEPNKHPKPGAPEMMVFHFKALKAGSTTLQMVLKRPFGKDTEPADHFSIKVAIEAK